MYESQEFNRLVWELKNQDEVETFVLLDGTLWFTDAQDAATLSRQSLVRPRIPAMPGLTPFSAAAFGFLRTYGTKGGAALWSAVA